MSSDIKTVDMTIALAPRQIGSENEAIKSRLNKLISQYVPEIDGVLIKWSDLNILGDDGIILDDQPYVFWKITFTAHVFRPVAGKLVKGSVHRLQKCYFIARAMDAFTVTVSIPEPLLEHDAVKELMVGQTIYFKFKGSSEGVYKGELDEESIALIKTATDQDIDSEKNVYDYAKDFEY